MGMYTKLYLKGIVKKEFIPVFYHVINYYKIKNGELTELSDDINTDEIKKLYEERVKSNDIPCESLFTSGNVLMMEFAEDQRADFITNNKNELNADTGELSVYSELKNYDSTIEKFIVVCSHMLESVTCCCTHYCEDEHIDVYEFNKEENSNTLKIHTYKAPIECEYSLMCMDELIKLTEKVCDPSYSVTMTLETITRPDIPNVNGVVYSKEAIDKAFENIINNKTPIYLTNTPYPLDFNDDATVVKPENIIGKVKDMTYETITVDVSKYDYDKLHELTELLNDGYKPGMRYLTDGMTVDNDGVRHVNDMKIISYDMLNKYEIKD